MKNECFAKYFYCHVLAATPAVHLWACFWIVNVPPWLSSGALGQSTCGWNEKSFAHKHSLEHTNKLMDNEQLITGMLVLLVAHRLFWNFLKVGLHAASISTSIVANVHYQHVQNDFRTHQPQRVAIKRNHNSPAPRDEIRNVVAGKERSHFGCWQKVNVAHAQNRSRQACRHRASHGFLACLSSHEVLLCRSSHIIRVLRN